MDKISVTPPKPDITFEDARKIAQAAARSQNPEAALMAWYDKKRNKYSPSKVGGAAKGLYGWEEYVRNNGGQRRVVVGDGDFIFIYT